MAFLSGKKLKEVLKTSIIDEFNPKRIKQLAYELSLGYEVFLTDSNGKPEVLNETNQFVEINPGQFALLLTKEKVSISNKYIGLISIKAGEKLKGLINVSGFHVDPGFEGQLLFSVYNAGPSTITLKKGEPYFLLWFSEITEELGDKEKYNSSGNTHQDQKGIPTRYIDSLKRGELASPNFLLNQIKEIKSNLSKYWWLLSIILGIAIATSIRFYWQKSEYEKGVRDGYSKYLLEKKIETKIDSICSKKINTNIGIKFDNTIIKKDSVE